MSDKEGEGVQRSIKSTGALLEPARGAREVREGGLDGPRRCKKYLRGLGSVRAAGDRGYLARVSGENPLTGTDRPCGSKARSGETTIAGGESGGV